MATATVSVLFKRHFEYEKKHYAGGPYLMTPAKAKELQDAQPDKVQILNPDVLEEYTKVQNETSGAKSPRDGGK
jgi:hypothetical protein